MLINHEDKAMCDLQVLALAANNSFAIAKEPDGFDETGERRFYLTGMYGNLDVVIGDCYVQLIGKGAYLGLEEMIFGWDEVQAGLDLIRDRYAEKVENNRRLT